MHPCIICNHGGKINQYNKVECEELHKQVSILTPLECPSFSHDQVKFEYAVMMQIKNIADNYSAGSDLFAAVAKIQQRIDMLVESVSDE